MSKAISNRIPNRTIASNIDSSASSMTAKALLGLSLIGALLSYSVVSACTLGGDGGDPQGCLMSLKQSYNREPAREGGDGTDPRGPGKGGDGTDPRNR